MKTAFLIILAQLLFSCSRDEELAEKTQVQSREEINQQNQNLERWSKDLEADYKSRQAFFQKTEGIYEGEMINKSNDKFKLRINLVSNLPIYQPERIRTLEEIQNDLEKLSFKAQAIQWKEGKSIASGCSFENVAPDFKNGKINLVSNNCDYAYVIYISNTKENSVSIENVEKNLNKPSQDLSTRIINLEDVNVTRLLGNWSSSIRPGVYSFNLLKISNTNEVNLANTYVSENQAYLLEELENDLQIRQRFYNALDGTFSGEFQIEDQSFRVEISLTTSLPAFVPNRIRTEEEIVSDLNNLYFNIQIKQWNVNSELSSVGCIIEEVRPDFNKGVINLFSENCKNTYQLSLATEGDESTPEAIAKKILSGEIMEVLTLTGLSRPSTNARTFKFNLLRSL